MTVVRYMHLLAMGFFVGGQIFLATVVVPTLRAAGKRDELRRIARRFGMGTVAALVIWHIRRPQLHVLEGAIFLGSLAIVWLGVSLAN